MTRVEIRNADGRVIRTVDAGPHGAGAVSFTWDGHDEAGNRAASGRYRISVTATDAEGHPVDAATRVRGQVSAVTYENGYPELRIGESSVMLGDVRTIEESPTPPPAAATAAGSP